MAQKTGVGNLIDILRNGGTGVMPTDTIYGLVGSALLPATVQSIYALRRRNSGKPMIILIGSVKDLDLFKIKLTGKQRTILNKLWPGKISVVLSCPSNKFSYLHRGKKSLAFRLPKPFWLRRIISETGPLVAPSANREGRRPATTVKEAKKYFGDKTHFYFNKGKLDSLPSTIVSFKNNKILVLREGAVGIKL